MKVLKFGGTSVGSVESINAVVNILRSQSDNVVVVVSAFSGITNKLVEAGKLAAMGSDYYKNELQAINSKQQEIISGLLTGTTQTEVINFVENEFGALEDILHGVFLIKELSSKTNDKILSYGERVSSFIISNVIEEAELVDSSQIIKTTKVLGKVVVDYDATNKLIAEEIDINKKITIVPGFVASNKKDELTTLGRGGSDFSGAIIAAALKATALEIWTDVDGFMTADPRVIKSAYPIEKLSYAEAMELSHFGAKVIYPPTILPVYHADIPVYIKNTFKPEAEGTLISKDNQGTGVKRIKGISSIGNIALLTVQGIGMVGVTGISSRLFGALATYEINVILISQASSENSISFAIDHGSVEKAMKAIENEFKEEIKIGQINGVSVEEGLSIVAIVGENMKHTTGVAGKLFGTIAKSGVNLVAIAQGASELNISFVISDNDLKKTLNSIHQSFFLSEYKDVNLFVMGMGLVGGCLLDQVAAQQEKLRNEHRLNIRLVGISNSRKMLFDDNGIDANSYKELVDGEGEEANLQGFINKAVKFNMANSVFVDCTASADVSELYKGALSNNISVVTANKVAASSEYSQYKELKQIALSKGAEFLFETNVGAGLPIISTINDLIKSGDKIVKLEAVLSGTLNFIVNTISKEIPLSETIIQAKENGFSEPDPRIDLSGIDVVRKIIILSRESGYEIDMKDVDISPFVPQEYLDTDSVDDFLAKVKELDGPMEEKRAVLEQENKIWRYVACLEDGKTKVELKEVASTHPFYDLKGSNNIVLITTERYNEEPMIIKGYGAGAEVTAAGVFADIIKVINA